MSACRLHGVDEFFCRQEHDPDHPKYDSRTQGLDAADLDVWVWCRQHTQARKVDAKCVERNVSVSLIDPSSTKAFVGSKDCSPISPFMSEREANRLSGNQPAGYGAWALGMEVEQ